MSLIPRGSDTLKHQDFHNAFLDRPGLLGRELEEHLDLEGRHLALQVPQTQK
jgi:hypothetical protein